jgi:protease IV
MLRLLRKLVAPILFLLALLWRPLRARSRRKALQKYGWLELQLEGEVVEVRHPPRIHPLVQRILRREEPIKVVLSRLRKFTEEVTDDPHAKGVLVRLGMLAGGWASAAEIRSLLARIRDAKKEVVIHLINHVGNKELMIASAGTKILMTPSGMFAAVGTAVPGLFLKEALEKIGVKIEVAGAGRFKSAPERFTRTDRSSFDREQTQALIDEFDDALLAAVTEGRVLERDAAVKMLDRAPIIGSQAKASGFVDAVARDEDLGEFIKDLEETDEAPVLVGAGTYLALRHMPPIVRTRKKSVGIIEVHGPIVDAAPGMPQYPDRLAVDRAVVADLRGALEDSSIDAVVLHVDSRGGSVTASDAIYSAVQRLDKEKPVVACFGDVSASGGYYVACGARSIVASPLTITGSIGVFAMLPTWPKLTEMLRVGHDVIKNRRNADLYDPWSGLDDEDRSHAQEGVAAMYDAFISLVATARGLTKEEVHAVAEGRVWTGKAARSHRLLDGLGGMEEAIDRAKDAAGGRFHKDPVLIKARGHLLRPRPYEKKDAVPSRMTTQLLSMLPDPRLHSLLAELDLMLHYPRSTIWSWSPIISP